jgi:hypothetical protein
MSLPLTNMLGLSSSVCITHIACYWKFFLLHSIKVLCQFRICKADHAYLTYLMLQRQLCHLNVTSLTTAKFKPLILSMLGFALSYTVNVFILMILYDFYLLAAQFCYVIVYMRKDESPVQIADLLCTSENFRWYGESCFAGASIIRVRCQPIILRRGKHTSLLI